MAWSNWARSFIDSAWLVVVVGAVGLFSDVVRGVRDGRMLDCVVITAAVSVVVLPLLQRHLAPLRFGALGAALVACVFAALYRWPPPLCMFFIFGGAAGGAVWGRLRAPC